MRITQRAISTTSLAGLNQNLAAIGKLQEQLTSGKSISKPSDSPTGTNKSMQTRSESAANEQFGRNITDGKSWLDTTDSTLMRMGEVGRRVRDLTVQGNNTGANSVASRAAIRSEVEQIAEGMIALANNQLGGRPLFGGVTSGDRAYDTTGAFIGRAVTAAEPEGINRRISEIETVRIDVTGPEAFGEQGVGQRDLFQIVKDIAVHVTDDPTLLAADLTALDEALVRMSNAQSVIGARASRVEIAKSINTDASLTLQNLLAETENVDLPRTIMELKMQETGYEAALSATAQVIRPTLVDFLR
jgi:flagellar hook-associated protein 3 FlgL